MSYLYNRHKAIIMNMIVRIVTVENWIVFNTTTLAAKECQPILQSIVGKIFKECGRMSCKV